MTIRGLIKKIPFAVTLRTWIIKELPFLFYTRPKVLTIQGSRMYLNIRENDKDMRKTFRAYAKAGIHEPQTTRLLDEILRNGDTFVDLGANIGYFSLLAARKVGRKGKVFSFEPEPRNFKYLTMNKEINHYDQMTPVNMAVSNRQDKIKLYICPYDTGHHTIQQSGGITSYETATQYDKSKISSILIETIPFDDFMASQESDKIDLIKMDVEGAELFALEGMKKTVDRNETMKMIIEFFPLLLDKMGSNPRAFLKKLTFDYRFDLYEIADDYNATRSADTMVLKKISGPEELMSNYEKDRMYHINLFAIKGSVNFPNLTLQ